jgi:hypothetical protein
MLSRWVLSRHAPSAVAASSLGDGQFVDYIDVVMARLLGCVRDESRLVAQVWWPPGPLNSPAACPSRRWYGCGWRSWDRSKQELPEIYLRFHSFPVPSSPPTPVAWSVRVCVCLNLLSGVPTDCGHE